MHAEIFTPIPLPPEYSELPSRFHHWHTWSTSSVMLLQRWEQAIAIYALPEPPMINLLGGKEFSYDYSYTLDPLHIPDVSLRKDMLEYARALQQTECGNGILFFRDLLQEGISGRTLHYLFAFLRAAMVETAGDEDAATYTPVGAVGLDERGFGLHADLYTGHQLFNIMDEVADDGSGRSIFMMTSELAEILPTLTSLPISKRERILYCLSDTHTEDLYEECLALLHDQHNPWVSELEQRLAERQIPISLRRGDGYLLNDRIWLHGREPCTKPITEKRLYRLSFNSK